MFFFVSSSSSHCATTDVINNLSLLQRGVVQTDDRLIARAVRQMFSLRRKLNKQVLVASLQKIFTSETSTEDQMKRRDGLVQYLDTDLDSSMSDETSTTTSEKVKIVPEVEVLLHILIVVNLLDTKQYATAVKSTDHLLQTLQQLSSRRTCYLLNSKAYFYYVRSHELSGTAMATVRPVLLNALRSAYLKHDNYSQATLINLLLRNYLHDNLYDAAYKLITKTPNVEFKSNGELARYNFYKGKISAIQLDYSDAYDSLMSAIRKAPQTGGKGFRVAANKMAIIVQLLLGEIPEKSVFLQKGMKKALKPYFDLTKQVKFGDLAQFRDVVEQYKNVYTRDRTYTLIQRIRQNVIRAGLKKISLSYSKISFNDICAKLQLDNPEDVEYIVAKAIRDGIIDATINHQGGYIKSRETADVYSTSEPAESFHKRLAYTLQLHNESVKAMRFPADVQKKTKKQLKEADENRKRQDELIDEIQNDEMDEEEGEL